MPLSRATIQIPRTWRSEIISVVVFVIMGILAIYLSYLFPWSIIEGELLPLWGSNSIRMKLPLFWFLPVITIGMAMYRIYNVRYTITERGVEAEIGVIALHRRLVRVWFEDVRGVQTKQNLLGRVLGFGNLEIGTAATGTVEVVLRGIATPNEVQEMIQRERDKRQKSQHFEKKQQNISKEQDSAGNEVS
jgi:uncharacterized membrane protein YdbT with pleckstrin-like domain